MTLYATDLDATLLDPQARLSAVSADLYRRLLEAGKLVTFVTARTPATVESILAPAHPKIPGVAMTGAAIWNPSTRLYESVRYHRASDVEIIEDICRRHGITPFVYTMQRGDNHLLVYHEEAHLEPIEREFVHDRKISDLKSFFIGEPAPAEARECTVLFFGMGDFERVQAAVSDIKAATDCYASWFPDTYHPGLCLLEVFAPGVSKAEGLLRLKTMLGADTIVAFGDNLNDIPMLQAADTAVAVENAHPDVKAVADIIIGPNTDDSVMRFIAQREGV